MFLRSRVPLTSYTKKYNCLLIMWPRKAVAMNCLVLTKKRQESDDFRIVAFFVKQPEILCTRGPVSKSTFFASFSQCELCLVKWLKLLSEKTQVFLLHRILVSIATGHAQTQLQAGSCENQFHSYLWGSTHRGIPVVSVIYSPCAFSTRGE
jgi:hypothetical protein